MGVTPDPVLRIVDAQAGGDISRVIIGGAPMLRGDTVAEQCADFAARHDHLRLKLIQPPHGELHMCPVLLLAGRGEEADFGVIIMESMGYPPISGTNLFCATAVALEYGFATLQEPESRLRVATPAGIVAITAHCREGRCRSVGFENTPTRIKSTAGIHDGSPGAPFPVTVISAGVDYAVVEADRLGVPLAPASRDELAAHGRRIAASAGTDFALFYDHLEVDHGAASCRIAVFQNPSVICRSPTGTGTSAMLALAYSRGVITADGTLTARSPTGGVFRGRIMSAQSTSSGDILRTEITGAVRIEGELSVA